MIYRRALFAAGACLAALSFATHAFATDADPPTKAPKAVPDVPFFYVVDNRLSYSYLFNATGPTTYTIRPDGSVNGKTTKQLFSFTHFDAWEYGTNFLNIDFIKSGWNDPANTLSPGCSGVNNLSNCAGATEFFGVARSTFGLNKILNTNAFTIGPMRNVSLEVGANYSTKNSTFAPATRAIVGGLQFAFDLPYKGYLNVSPMIYKEWNHSAFVGLSGEQEYNPTWLLEINYHMNLGFLPENMRYFSVSGIASIYGPKGNENGPNNPFVPGSVPTKTEIFSEPIRLTFDAGSAIWGKRYAHGLDLWVAWRYWENKFGLDHNNSLNCKVGFSPTGPSNKSCVENTLHAGVSVKF